MTCPDDKKQQPAHPPWPPNGSNGSTSSTGYSPEETDRLTAAGAVLTWEDLDAHERLECCLANPHRGEWLSDDALETFADFRNIDKQWVRIIDGYETLRGKAHILDKAVTAVLKERAAALVQAPPLAASLVSGAELLALTVPPKAPYLDWLTERALVLVYGPRGVGKTYWLLELALCLTMPRPFLKWPVQHQVPVLFVDGEMALETLQERLQKLAGDYLPPALHFLPSELVYARSGRDLTLTATTDRLAIDAMLEEHHIKVLILDNISCLFPGLDESKKQDWEPINAWLIRLRHRGITVIVGHHAGKNGQQRGTSGREDSLDTTIALTLPPATRPRTAAMCIYGLRKPAASKARRSKRSMSGWRTVPMGRSGPLHPSMPAGKNASKPCWKTVCPPSSLPMNWASVRAISIAVNGS